MNRKTLFNRVDEVVAAISIGVLGICGSILVVVIITTIILMIIAFIKNN